MQVALFDEHRAACETTTKEEPRSRYDWRDDPADGADDPGVDLFGARAGRVETFASGSSALWDMAGYMMVGLPLGVTATEMTLDGRIGKLRSYVNSGYRVFVDSGAFGAFGTSGVVDFEGRVFPVYDALLDDCDNADGFVLVMPDVVGDERATAALQERYRDRILVWVRSGAECIFPLQNGGADPVADYERVRALLGDLPFVVGVPSNKKAWTAAQTVAFARAVQPRRMHLLGLAKARRIAELKLRIHEVSPDTELSCDACQILANVGVGRRITDRCTSRLADAVQWVRDGAWLQEDGLTIPCLGSYMFDVCYEPGFLTEAQARAMAAALGCDEAVWGDRFAAAAATGLNDALAVLDPDEEWAEMAATEFVRREIYEPWVEKLLRGPIRAWEVARLGCRDDPVWYRLSQKLGKRGQQA